MPPDGDGGEADDGGAGADASDGTIALLRLLQSEARAFVYNRERSAAACVVLAAAASFGACVLQLLVLALTWNAARALMAEW